MNKYIFILMSAFLRQGNGDISTLFSYEKENPQSLAFGCTSLCSYAIVHKPHGRDNPLGKSSVMSSTQKANPLFSLARGFEREALLYGSLKLKPLGHLEG